MLLWLSLQYLKRCKDFLTNITNTIWYYVYLCWIDYYAHADFGALSNCSCFREICSGLLSTMLGDFKWRQNSTYIVSCQLIMQSYTTVMKFIGNSATVEASILLAKSNLFHPKPSGVIPVLSCLRWRGGGYYWAINDPIQQLVSTKIGGLIFVGGWIIGRLQYSATLTLRQPQNTSLLHGSMQEYYGNTHKCCLIIYRNWMAAICVSF